MQLGSRVLVLLGAITAASALQCCAFCVASAAERIYNFDAYEGNVPSGAVNVVSGSLADKLFEPDACCCFATTEGCTTC